MANRFRHQEYAATPPTSPWRLLAAESCPSVGSDDFQRRMMAAGDALRAAGVATIFLAHGTFAGSDALGLAAAIDTVTRRFSDALRRIEKQLIDALAGDVGNYPPDYAALFERSINGPDRPRISVRTFHWSSEDNHIGRADGAVRLIGELMARRAELLLHPPLPQREGRGEGAECGVRNAELKDPTPTHSALRTPHSALPPRFLLWGHSHAGNVFALMTNLLSGDRSSIRRFFRAARPYYRWPLLRYCDVPMWRDVRAVLRSAPPLPPGEGRGEGVFPHSALAPIALDLVTFGTPIRYGWDTDGCDRLLHFVHHRPARGLPEYLTPFPPTAERILSAADGDYVQQLGIAGTNVMPNMLLNFRSWNADRRLGHLLQQGIRARDLWRNLSFGRRVPDSGTTLLVDYGPIVGTIAQHLAGHAVYTGQTWLLFHLEETVRQLYAAEQYTPTPAEWSTTTRSDR